MAMNKRLVLQAVTEATDSIQDALAIMTLEDSARPHVLKALGKVMSFEQELKEELGI